MTKPQGYFETTNTPQVVPELYTIDQVTGELVRVGSGEPAEAINWGDIENKPQFIAAGATRQEARDAIGAVKIGPNPTDALAGNTNIPSGRKLVPIGGTNGQVLKIVDDAPAWGADTNTTYTLMTQAIATAGTSTAANTINALVLKTTIDNALAPLLARIDALEDHVEMGPNV